MITEKQYKIELITLEPLRIGAVQDPRSAIQNPLAKSGDKVVIPGPSLKGALRSEIERFLIESYYDEGSKRWPADKEAFQPCIPSTIPSIDEQSLIVIGKYRPKVCSYPNKKDEKSSTICPACYFLGAMGLPGFIRVPFLYTKLPPEELYSARIDRGNNKIVDQTNRSYQLVPANTQFIGNLVILFEDSVNGWEMGKPRPLRDKTIGDKWLEGSTSSTEELIDTYIIERLKNIKILGGYKSKGFGSVKIEATPLQ